MMREEALKSLMERLGLPLDQADFALRGVGMALAGDTPPYKELCDEVLGFYSEREYQAVRSVLEYLIDGVPREGA